MAAPSGSSLSAVYILAGGDSRRFGSDKARFELHGVPLLQRAVELVRPFAPRVVAVAKAAGQYDDLGVETIGDRVEDRGPLGGLHAAVADADPGWFALVACDWVGARAQWLAALIDAIDDAEAVVYRGDRFEPTFALYHTRVRPRVDRQVSSGVLDLQTLLHDAATIELPLPADWSEAVNANRRVDVDRKLR